MKTLQLQNLIYEILKFKGLEPTLKENRVLTKSPALNLDSGCCSMNISFPAHGLNDLGCCAYSEFGCCPDDLQVASGPYGKMTSL